MMRGRRAPFVVPTLVSTSRQSVEVPQMSCPQERQMKEQKQKVKIEHNTKILEVEEPQTNGDIYENWMDSHESS
jgi:hypothetical protein